MKQHPAPWKWDNESDWQKFDNIDWYEGNESEKYLNLRLVDARGNDVLPLRVDHYSIELDGNLPDAQTRARIVAAVNNADALAEALTRILSNPAFQDLIAANPQTAYLDRDARAALAAYRGAK